MCLIGAMVAACASKPVAAPAPPASSAESDDQDDAGPDEPEQSPDASAPILVDMPERTRAPSTASYEQALSTPEPLNVNDDGLHLTDAQLTGPVRSVLNGCPVPPRAKITIKTVVLQGRAIGVTVLVRIDKPKPPAKPPKKPPKPPSKAAAKKEAKAIAKATACVDTAVRAVVWPPSRRRDSFTTEF